MSFLGGPECSTAGNPLTQFTKHVQDDKSLQRDRMVGRGPGGQYESIRSQRPMGQQDKVGKSRRSGAATYPTIKTGKLINITDDG